MTSLLALAVAAAAAAAAVVATVALAQDVPGANTFLVLQRNDASDGGVSFTLIAGRASNGDNKLMWTQPAEDAEAARGALCGMHSSAGVLITISGRSLVGFSYEGIQLTVQLGAEFPTGHVVGLQYDTRQHVALGLAERGGESSADAGASWDVVVKSPSVDEPLRRTPLAPGSDPQRPGNAFAGGLACAIDGGTWSSVVHDRNDVRYTTLNAARSSVNVVLPLESVAGPRNTTALGRLTLSSDIYFFAAIAGELWTLPALRGGPQQPAKVYTLPASYVGAGIVTQPARPALRWPARLWLFMRSASSIDAPLRIVTFDATRPAQLELVAGPFDIPGTRSAAPTVVNVVQ